MVTDNQATGARARRWPLKFSKKARKRAAIAAGVFVALSAAGLWLLGREATLIYVADKAVERSGGRLQLAEVRGSLLSTVRVRDIRFEDKFGKLGIADAHLEWKPLRLLIGQIAVDEV